MASTAPAAAVTVVVGVWVIPSFYMDRADRCSAYRLIRLRLTADVSPTPREPPTLAAGRAGKIDTITLNLIDAGEAAIAYDPACELVPVVRQPDPSGFAVLPDVWVRARGHDPRGTASRHRALRRSRRLHHAV